MGGVLVDLDVEACKSAFKRLLGYHKIDELIDPCHQKGIYGKFFSYPIYNNLSVHTYHVGLRPCHVKLLDTCHVKLDTCHVERSRDIYHPEIYLHSSIRQRENFSA